MLWCPHLFLKYYFNDQISDAGGFEDGFFVRLLICPNAHTVFLIRIILLPNYYYVETNTYYQINITDTTCRKILCEGRCGLGTKTACSIKLKLKLASQLIMEQPVPYFTLLLVFSCLYLFLKAF